MPNAGRRPRRAQGKPMGRRGFLRAAAGIGLALPGVNILSACDFATADDEDQPGDTQTEDIVLTGSGASFPDPIYQVWIEEFTSSVRPDVTINYQSVGSGQGKRDFINNVTDFGSSDAYLTDEELERVSSALHIPTVIGAVSVAYNLEVEGLQLSGETLAAMFLGDITSWNDPRIEEENPDIQLPDGDIGTIFRSDGSGTTWIFTDFLSKVSDEWESRVGTGTTVQWPVGFGGEKNAGVMAAVQQTPGSIGYVELIYSQIVGMPVAAIQNSQGNFVQPELEAVQEAAAGYLDELPDDLRVSITNPPQGENAYPIAGLTWLLLREEQENRDETEALVDFITWALTEGDQMALDLHYAPLPDDVLSIALGLLEQVEVDGEQIYERPEEYESSG